MNPIQKIFLLKIKKELGDFKQDRYRFYEERPELIKVIEVQFLNLPDSTISFTINLGIYVHLLSEILWHKQKPRKIDASECTFFCNVNSIVTSFQGKPKVKYWDLGAHKSLPEAIDLIRSQILPFLGKVNTLEDLNNLMNTTEYPGKYVVTYPILNLVLKYVLGKDDEIMPLIEKLESENATYFKPQIHAMNQKLIQSGYKIIQPM